MIAVGEPVFHVFCCAECIIYCYIWKSLFYGCYVPTRNSLKFIDAYEFPQKVAVRDEVINLQIRKENELAQLIGSCYI